MLRTCIPACPTDYGVPGMARWYLLLEATCRVFASVEDVDVVSNDRVGWVRQLTMSMSCFFGIGQGPLWSF